MPTYIRLLPHNPKMGALAERYTYRSMTFRGGKRPHWYEVKDKRLLTELRALKQDQYDPRSLPLFEIKEEADKLATEKRETDQFLASIGAVRETLSIAADLKHPPTHTIGTKEPSGPITSSALRHDTLKHDELGGRASALPPLRENQLMDATDPPPPLPELDDDGEAGEDGEAEED
jgi:hypothetical protein